MNNQEAFDGVWTRLVDNFQLGRCVTGSGCVYINPAGNRCAIGALMPVEVCKELMNTKLVGWNIYGLIHPGYRIDREEDDRVRLKVVKIFSGVNAELLSDMQKVHDNYGDDLEKVKSAMKQIAKMYNLTCKEV